MTSQFVNKQRIIAFDENNNMKTFAEPEDKSYEVIKRLYTTINENNFELFKEIYEKEYINDPTISNYFNFGDTSPWEDYNTYALCRCENKNEEPEYINKFMSSRPCCCANGKRYLAYLCAFNQGKFNHFDMHYKFKDSDKTTPIKEYLLSDGPIDLIYRQIYQSIIPDYFHYENVFKMLKEFKPDA
jgi:hypothetical protein